MLLKMLALPIFPVRASILGRQPELVVETHGKSTVPVARCFMFMLALPIFPVRTSILGRQPERVIKTQRKSSMRWHAASIMLALPIFPASHPASIVGEGVLNFCVRDGNRWTHSPINTNYQGCTLKTEHCSIAQIKG